MDIICVNAVSVEEVRAAAKMLRANHRALTADYIKDFAAVSAAHAKGTTDAAATNNTVELEEEKEKQSGEASEEEDDAAVKAAGKAINAASPKGFLPSFLVPPTAVPERPPAVVCANPNCCNEEMPGGASFLVCSRCKSAHYCQRSCQKDHWACHKDACKAIQERAELLCQAAEAKAKTASQTSTKKGPSKKRGKREKR